MVAGLELLDDGTHVPLDVKKENLQPNRVFCIVHEPTKSIYLWKGSKAGVRKQLAGALAATEIRLEQGTKFRVRAIDQGEEPAVFLNSL